MQSVNFNNTSLQLNPIAVYWSPSPNESANLTNFVNAQTGAAYYSAFLSSHPNLVNNWAQQNGVNATTPYKSAQAWKQALAQFINNQLATITQLYSLPTLATYPALQPVSAVCATDAFTAPPFAQVDACFNGTASTLSPAYLRLFVSLPLFTGSGLYSFLCTDSQILTVAIDKQATNDVFFHIINKHSGQCLNVSGGGTTPGTVVVQWPASGGYNDLWRIEPWTGCHLVANASASQTLNVPNNSTSDGTQLVQWLWGGGTANEIWQFVPAGGGYYKIVSKSSGKLVTVAGGSTANGAPVVQQADIGADYQLWSLGII